MDNLNPTSDQLNARTQDSGQTPVAPPVNPTIDASALGGSSLTLTPAPTPGMTGVSNNNGISIPKAEDVINQGATATPAEQQQQTLLQKVASLIGGGKTKTTLQNDAEQAAGVTQAKSAYNDLNTQLEGLNNQATSLQNDAAYTIPNQIQLDNQGTGVVKASTAARTADALRLNQIQQGRIATQALTVKSALFGAQGKLALAQDAADKAATAQYEQQQQQIDYQKAQLDALAPTLSKQEKAQAAIVQAKLQDRQTQIDNAKEDKKAILAMASATLKLYPTDPAAQYAAQQALAESNKEVPNLQAALALIGKYQSDPQAAIKAVADLEQTRAQTKASLASVNNSNASAEKTRVETQQLINGSGSDKVQQKLEQDYRAILVKEVSSRSGTLGTEDAKVSQANHLASLFNQYYDPKTGNYYVPKSQYGELVLGLAGMISKTGTPTESQTDNILQKTAKGDIAGAIAYITGSTPTGTTQAVLQNLKDSIDRQAQVAVSNREAGLNVLRGLAPTDLDPTRRQALEKNTLVPYSGIGTKTTTTLMLGPDGKQYDVPNDKVDAFTKAGGKKQ